MQKYLVSINDLPPDGKEFVLDDQNIWLEPIKEYKMDCDITKPLNMKVFVMNADDGCLTRGVINGAVTVPCDRCAEDAQVSIDSRFDEYEEIPDEKHAGGDNHVVYDRGAPMLNLAEVAWEQFMLALPSQPLCKADCKGLCPKCGVNLNANACSCEPEEGDSRMAALKNVKINRK